MRGALDGAVEIEFVGRAGAGEFSQAAQRDLDVAGAEFDLVVEILELAFVPHFDRAEIAVGVLADAHAFRIVAVGAIGRSARRADPFRAALVAALLLGQPLLQRLEQFFQPAHGLDLLLFFLGEIFLRELLQPLGRDVRFRRVAQQFQPLEHVAEHAVELVEIALVLHQRGARQIIEILHPAAGEIGLHRLHQGQILAQRDRHAGGFEFLEKIDEHGARIRPPRAAVKRRPLRSRIESRRCSTWPLPSSTRHPASTTGPSPKSRSRFFSSSSWRWRPMLSSTATCRA